MYSPTSWQATAMATEFCDSSITDTSNLRGGAGEWLHTQGALTVHCTEGAWPAAPRPQHSDHSTPPAHLRSSFLFSCSLMTFSLCSKGQGGKVQVGPTRLEDNSHILMVFSGSSMLLNPPPLPSPHPEFIRPVHWAPLQST